MGYEIERFVSTPPKELTCGVCHMVCHSSDVVLSSCECLFCRNCIEIWLNTHNTCPNDGSMLQKNMLTDPRRFIKSLLLSLKLKCKFYDKGCEFVSTIEEEADHYSTCPFNEKLNKSSSTSDNYEQMSDQINTLKSVVEYVHKENLDLKAEVEKLRSKLNFMEEFIATNNIMNSTSDDDQITQLIKRIEAVELRQNSMLTLPLTNGGGDKENCKHDVAFTEDEEESDIENSQLSDFEVESEADHLFSEEDFGCVPKSVNSEQFSIISSLYSNGEISDLVYELLSHVDILKFIAEKNNPHLFSEE